jgi:metal-responsive CopG/Arc/MetJ family transcriptional regulator
MKAKKGDGKKMKAQSTAQVRATISFPPDLYETLEELAKQKKVSLAWVVRDAAEGYVANRTRKGVNGQGHTTHGTGKRTRRAT